MSDSVASLMASADTGDPAASEALFATLYAELHRLARHELARNPGGGTLNTTTLLHEAYLRMAGGDETRFPDHARFMGYASRVMRGLIIDYARNRQAKKRGGQFEITAMSTDVAESLVGEQELGRIGDAIDELARIEPVLAQVVDLKFFCGFSLREIAEMRQVSERTVQRDWEKARIYLYHAIGPSDDGS